MAGVSSLGVGSGLDLNSIITQLMSIERQPLDNLSTQKSTLNSQISAYGQVKSALSSFQSAAQTLADPTNFAAFTSSSSDSTIASATATTNSAAGSYGVTISQLAQAKVVASAGYASSTSGVTNGGTMTFTAGSTSFSINVTAGESLEAIRDAINNQTATTNGTTATQSIATASVVNSGTSSNPSYSLVVSSAGLGSDGAVTIGFDSSSSALQSELNFTQKQAAVDAKINVNGMDFTRSSNTISDLVPGATLTLTKTGTATITIGRDVDAIASKINSFITAYNKVQSTVTGLHQKGGTLEADNTVNSILSTLQSVFNNAPATGTTGFSNYTYLAQIGISFQKDGTLSLDKTALTTAVNTNFSNVVNLFTDSTNGYAQRLYDTTTNMVTTGGLIDTQTKSMNSQVSNLDDRMTQMQTQLDNTEAQLRKQYSAMDSLVASLKQNSSYLSAI